MGTTFFLGLLKPLLWLLPVLVLGAVLKSPWFKGWLGERKVRELIRRRLDPSIYREFSNLTLRDEFGETTQIDHVYVSPFGVLVIETKHMGHWISGDQYAQMWTQTIYRNKYRFQNPIRQNHRHIKVLESALGLPEEAFKSIVVFTGDCTFKSEMPDEVCTCSDLIEYIHSLDKQILGQEQVDAICRDLENRRLAPSLRTHREHLDSLRRRHGEPRPASPPPPRSSAEGLMQAATDRLLHAAEHRIRTGGRRAASRAVGHGFGLMLVKALLALGTVLLIWWTLSSGIGQVVDSLQKRPVATTPRVVQPVEPPPPPPPRRARPAASTQPQIEFRQPTPEELSEWQRQNEESMRILAPHTPEMPLALPRKASE